ncbi:hypothetical protein HZS_5977 [Henneguya salminicola]|nr:hypothetical protein HZS_5977 [Henneguya salminicola]
MILSTLEMIITKIIGLMNELNLDVNYENVYELIASHEELPLNEYLIKQQESMEIQNEDKVDESTVKSLIIKNMNAGFMHFNKFRAIMKECDLNGEGISQVRRAIEKDAASYRELYYEKRINVGTESILDKFIKKHLRIV